MVRARNVAKAVRDGVKDTTSSARLREIIGILRKNEVAHGLTPDKVVALLEDLGPTFIKMGQIFAARSDVIPQEYCSALAKLRNATTPEPFDVVRRRLDEAYGGRFDEIFDSFDETPLGSASIAQVHRAHLRREGVDVAVKVRRANVKEDMLRDLQLMRRAADLLNVTGNQVIQGVNLELVIDELERTVSDQIDFNKELGNLLRFAKGCQGEPQVSCPAAYGAYSNEVALVMEFVEGLSLEHVSELRACGYDLKELGDRLADAHMRAMVEGGFYHADPHPANVIIRPIPEQGEQAKGKRPKGEVVWIDCGMMGELSPHERHLFLEMMKAMVFKDGHRLTDLFIEWGRIADAPGKKFNYGQLMQNLTTLVNRYSAEDAHSMDIAALLNDLMAVLETANVIMPTSFVMLVRGLANLQGTLIALTPEISILAVVERYVKGYIVRNFDPVKEAEQAAFAAKSVAERTAELPNHMSNVLDMMEKGRMRIGMDLTDAEVPLEKVSSIIDRASLSVITAGLFIGSSIIASTGVEPQIMGLPAIGFLGYGGAAVLSVYIVVDIYRSRRRR